MDRVDARYKTFKEKLKKLGYVKADAKKVNAVMEKIGDFGMMSDGGNKKIARAVSQAKNEKDLRQKLDKISKMAQGKYAEAEEDEVIDRAIDAFNSKAKGVQNRPDAAMLMQLRKFKDYSKDGEVRTDDMKKIKVKRTDAVKVHDVLMKVKTPIRTKYLQLLQKDKKSFEKAFKAILKVA
jgi:putative heme degradation protein